MTNIEAILWSQLKAEKVSQKNPRLITLLTNKFLKQGAVNLIQKFAIKMGKKYLKNNIKEIWKGYAKSHYFLTRKELWEWVEKIVNAHMSKVAHKQNINMLKASFVWINTYLKVNRIKGRKTVMLG